MDRPLPRLLLLIALGAGLALLALLDRAPPQPVPAPTAAAEPAAPKAQPAAPPAPSPRRSEGSFPNSSGVAVPAVPAVPSLPAPARSDEKRIAPPEPAVQKGIEPDPGGLVPTATEAVVPPPPSPDSVFGWGPWTGPTAGGTPAAPAAPDGTTPAVQGFTPPLSVAAPPTTSPTNPPGSLPDLAIRPGHGFGDRNHTHIHRGPR